MFTILDNVKHPKDFCIAYLINEASTSNVNKDDDDADVKNEEDD